MKLCVFIAFLSLALPCQASMKLSTTAFEEGASIPTKYTCKGENIAPPLSIQNVPKKTVSLALILNDPDARGGQFAHWIAWNISPETQDIPEKTIFAHTGITGFGGTGYQGPCPPPGQKHHYVFTLYALDINLDIPDGASQQQLLHAIQGHILESAQTTGTFQR